MSSCARVTRSFAPTAWNTTRRTGAPSSTGAVEFSGPALKVRGSSGDVLPGARRAIRGRAVRAAAAQCPRRGAQHAGGRERHGDAGGRVVHHLPGHRPWPGRSSPAASCSTHARNKGTGHGTQRRVQGRAVHLSTLDDLPDRPAAQERLLLPEHRRLVAQRRGDRAALLLEHPAERRLHGRARLLRQARRGLRRRAALPHAAPARHAGLQLPAQR